ncbi:MAG TPA: phage baseplate assembly protein V [Gemmatimonadales bacterium]|jgi:uncharacterized protein involved in type VI secretion and phage assembly|nr:phage baseplate assembly protein V [Gemmatimonadales bacterium]
MRLEDRVTLLEDLLRHRWFGKYRGTVKSNEDDDQRGRIQVVVPAVTGTLELWAMPCVPYAGPSVGFFSLPPEGAGVWIEFEGGDPSFPIWTGCFWADGEVPEDGDPEIRLWHTENVKLTLDDSSGTATLENDDGTSLELAGDATLSASEASVEVGTTGVTCASGQAGKVEVGAASVRVNSGSLEVV